MDELAQMSCMVCGASPVELHHAKGGSMKERGVHVGRAQRSSDFHCIPLCPRHHRQEQGLHQMGVLTWESAFGTQAGMLDRLAVITGRDVWALAVPVPRRAQKRLEKVLPRRY